MGTASAKPGKLQTFVTAAAEIRGELQTRITELRASYDSFQWTGTPVANPDLMDVELPGLITNYENDESFVAVVRQAFLDADCGERVDGAITVDETRLETAFDAAAVAMGFDPTQLTVPRSTVTVDDPVAAGVPQTSGFVADPVCTATGHFLEVEDDFTMPDRLDVLRWRRTYSSRFVAGGPFGRGWASWASAMLVAGDDGSVAYQGPDGQLAVFVPSTGAAADDDGDDGRDGGRDGESDDGRGDGHDGRRDDGPVEYERVSGIAARLSRAAGGWVLRWDRHAERPGATWHFDADGLPRRIDDPGRGTVTFTHTGGVLTGVAHEGGRNLEIDWDGARIVAVRSSCGRVARYRYDDAGDLSHTERVLGDRSYVTDDAGRMVEVWDADGVRLCRNTFDDEGRVTRQVSPFGREVTFAYHPGNRTIVSDTGDGPVNIYEHDQAGRLIGLVDDQGHVMRRVFDDQGRVIAANGFDGTVSHQTFAADGRAAARSVDAAPDEQWDYDDAGRVVRHAVDGGAEVVFEYPDDTSVVPSRLSGPLGWHVDITSGGGLITSLTDADGVRLTYGHDADGNVTTTTNALGATTTVEHHPSGEVGRVAHPDGAVAELERDAAGRLLVARSPLGDEVRFTWTPAGRLAAIEAPDGGLTTFEYATHGGLERVVDSLGVPVELTHDHLERLVRVVAPGAAKWDLDYTGTGRLAQLTDPTGASWAFDYDAEGRPVRSTDPLGHASTQRYDRTGRLAEHVDPTGALTRLSRDGLGRVTAVDRPDGGTTAYDWDIWGRSTAVRLPDGDERRTTYTPAGRVHTVTTAEGRGWTYGYDAAGRLVTATDAAGATTEYRWDECDRLVETVTPAGRGERRTFDAAGRVVETTLAGGTWRTAYDAAGRPVAVTDPAGGTRRYRYDERGQLVAASDALGHEVRYRYDERGDVVGVVDPFGGFTSVERDAKRRPLATTDQLGRRTVVGRDAAGRVVRRELPTGEVVEWRRDARGLATDVRVNGRDAVVFDHDRAGRPVHVHEPSPNRTFTFTWTVGGRLAALDIDGATLRWERDLDGLVTSRHDAAGRRTTWTYDRAGRVSTMGSDRWGTVELDRDLDGRLVALRAAGVERRWDRDAQGMVAVYRETGPAGERTATLRRDAAGRVVEVEDDAGVVSYGYDAAGQLLHAVTPAGAWTWTYDDGGRLVAETGPDGLSTYSYDEAHQLVRIDGPSGTTAFSYDAAGRRTGADGPTGTRRYAWDALGRLTGIESGDGVTEVDVDALGNLARFGRTRFTWDVGRGVVADLVSIDDGSDDHRDDREVVSVAGHALALAGGAGVAGNGATGGGVVEWLSANWHHDVTGSVAGVDAVDPWGAAVEPAASPSSAPGMSGELDLGGLTWLRNRVYDPATRQFLSPDPLPGVPGTPVAAWPYHYGANDPVGNVDPLGLQPLTLDQYNEYREQETSVQWGNIIMVTAAVGSAFIPGGPLIAAAVGASVGMAPNIYTGITTGEWDTGAMLRNGLIGGLTGGAGKIAVVGMTGRVSIPAATSVPNAVVRSSATGATTATTAEVYDIAGLPGGDGSFDTENIVINTVVSGATGGADKWNQLRNVGNATPVAPRSDLDLPPAPSGWTSTDSRLLVPPNAGELVPQNAGDLVVPPAPSGWSPTDSGLLVPQNAGELAVPSNGLVLPGAG